MEDVVPDRYNDGNRAFLQAFMARGTLTLREAQPIIASILTVQDGRRAQPTRPNDVTQDDFNSYMAAANEALHHFNYEIRSTMHQVRKERVWAIVNTTSDPLTQLATLHSAEEIAFVKRVIDAMFEKYNSPRMEAMCLDEIQANKLRTAPRIVPNEDEMEDDNQPQQSQLKGIKSSEAEMLMRLMVDEGWFERSEEGLYSLSPRALMELRSWLVESYNDPEADPNEWQRVKFCEACKEIVTAGQRCGERDCNARLHDICQDAFWRSRREKKCPKCNLDWDGNHFVGGKAVTETEAYQRGRTTGRRGRSSNLREQIMQDEDDMEDDE